MLTRFQAFLWKKYRRKIVPVFMVILIAIPILLGVSLFLLKQTQTVGYFVSQEEVTIEVKGKETKDMSIRHCIAPGSNGGCGAYEIITSTLYIIVTPMETFFTEAEIYGQLENGRNYQVVLAGFHNSALPPRRITKVVGKD